MACPYLEYRRSDDAHEFDHDRPYCTVAEEFVSPMRADICNSRHGFDFAEDCEIFPGPPEEASLREADADTVASDTTE